MTEPPRLLDRVCGAVRARHYSRRTEEAYVMWIRRFILFHHKRHPSSMGAEEVNAFLTSLAVEQRVSASTQNQALSALLSLYRVVLEDPLPWLKIWSGPGAPSVSRSSRVIDRMDGVCRLVAQLLYGSGLRLLEALMLRVKDVDFERDQLTVRDPKWKRDRVTMLPRTVAPALQEQLSEARLRHGEDLARISHTPPAASAANSLSASLRSVALLDVLSSTPSSRSRRAPRIQGRSRRSRGGGV